MAGVAFNFQVAVRNVHELDAAARSTAARFWVNRPYLIEHVDARPHPDRSKRDQFVADVRTVAA